MTGVVGLLPLSLFSLGGDGVDVASDDNDDNASVLLSMVSIGTPAVNMDSNIFILMNDANARNLMDVVVVVSSTSFVVLVEYNRVDITNCSGRY